MQQFLVGGAVRDLLLGKDPKDRDFVVVGATPDDMLRKGFKQVGAAFPVFLHPDTGEEFALARVERKNGNGYNGFSVATENVTLVDDLARRDLTINAMAMDEQGNLVDPFGGKADLDAKVLKHVSPAFAEDPLRVLRVARFLARFGNDWSVHPSTFEMMSQLVESGELDFLTPERIWQEFGKGFSEAHPILMLDCLQQLKVFERKPFGEFAGLANLNRSALTKASNTKVSSVSLFALSFSKLWTKAETANSKIPSIFRESAHGLHCALQHNDHTPAGMLELVEKLDALRQTERLSHILTALQFLDAKKASKIEEVVGLLKTLNMASIVSEVKDKSTLGSVVRQAKLAHLQSNL